MPFGRTARHCGVSTCRRDGLGFWDSFSDAGDVISYDAPGMDFIDVGDFEVPVMDDFNFDSAIATIDGDYVAVDDSQYIQQDAEAYGGSGYSDTPSPVMQSRTPPISGARSPTTAEAGVLQTILKAGPGLLDTATRLLKTQQQIDMAKQIMQRGAVPTGYTFNAQGQLVPSGMFGGVMDYIRKNPVPVFFMAAGLAVAISKRK